MNVGPFGLFGFGCFCLSGLFVCGFLFVCGGLWFWFVCSVFVCEGGSPKNTLPAI